jgi:hypothetical protein
VALLATFASGCCRALAILSKIARIIRCTTATVAPLAAFASGFHGTCPIMREVAGAFLSADMSRTRRFFAIEREVATICDGSRFRHGFLPIFRLDRKRKRRGQVALPPVNRCWLAALQCKSNAEGWPDGGRTKPWPRRVSCRDLRDGDRRFPRRNRGELNPENPDARELPDHHVGTSAADVKIWVEQMARSMGYRRVF